ncbi:MAG: protein kinase [Myxococcales bacterium]|nr:protein kinase [Myxococcales bacterium]
MNVSASGPSLRRLGRYHLSDWLGGGPTGEVFRAKVYGVAGIDREFAVKRFQTSFVASSDVAAALASAARMYGALEHPRVARLHEFGESDGHIFTATEYVPGLDLTQLIEQGRLSLGTSAGILVQVGRALGYAHGRGLSHLGLCPTNVICMESGAVKVTDFGVLSPRLSSSPVQDDSLRLRLCYLAPEQLEGQSTSPATDVYQLGTLAYELMVGRRPYSGGTNAELAKQILGAPLPETGFPKPYDKLLRRALARSPFERFPDAGAMADALEAALRSSPVPGKIADAGLAVTSRLEVLKERRENQASGALSFPMPPPQRASKEEVLESVSTPPPRPSMARNHSKAKAAGGLARVASTMPNRDPGPSDAPALSFSRLASADDTETHLDCHEAETRVGGSEEEIRILRATSISDEPTVVRVVAAQLGAGMELGLAGTDPSVAREDLLGGVASAYTLSDEAPTRAKDEPRAETHDEEKTSVHETIDEDEATFTLEEDNIDARPARRNLESTMGELESLDTEGSFLSPVAPEGGGSAATSGPNSDAAAVGKSTATDQGESDLFESSETSDPERNELSELIVVNPEGITSVPMSHIPAAESGIGSRAHRMPPEVVAQDAAKEGKRSRKSILLPVVLGSVMAAAGAFFGYQYLAGKKQPGATTAKVSARDSGILIPVASRHDSVERPEPTLADAAPTEALAPDTAVEALPAPEPDAGEARLENIAPDELPGRLRIETSPPGAKVYLDGTMVGTAPVELDASTDRHRLSLLLAGYDLYTGEIGGEGDHNIDMTEVTPPGGPGGIKVRCRNKNRYYVYVDGNPVGQLCPSERIGVSKGSHVVEIYDPLTDSRRAFNVDVVDTRLSVRVKVD